MNDLGYRPTDLSRHPLQIFLLLLCLATSLPTLLGKASPPNSIEELMPRSMVLAWSAYLCAGCFVALVGIAWKNRVTGMIIEQVGLVWVSGGAMIYGAAILLNVGFERGGGTPAGFIFGFALACALRWLQIQRDIRRLKGLVQDAGVQNDAK